MQWSRISTPENPAEAQACTGKRDLRMCHAVRESRSIGRTTVRDLIKRAWK